MEFRILLAVMTLLLAQMLLGCQRGEPLGTLVTEGPTIRIDDPPSGTRVSTGQEIRIRSTATDLQRVTRIELYINEDFIAEDFPPMPGGQQRVSVVQRWVPVQPGRAEVVVYAYNGRGERSRPAAIVLEVTGKPLATPRPIATASPSREAVPAEPEEPASPTPEMEVEGRVSVLAGLNVRSQPNAAAQRLGGLDYGDAVTGVSRTPDGAWVKVRYGADRQVGWVASQFVAWQDDIQALPAE